MSGLKSKFLLVLLPVLLFGIYTDAQAARVVLDVGLNRAELVNLNKPMAEVMIANPEIADVVVHGSQKISVIGKKIGSTNLRFFDDKANLINEIDIVVGYDLPAIRRSLKRFFPTQNVGLETINNSLAVSGVVPDAQTANRIMQVVYEFVKESRKDDAASSSQSYVTQDNRFPGIVNLLTLNSGQQVMLKVRIGEVKRTALKSLGINLENVNGTANSLFQFGTGAGTALLDASGAVGTGLFGGFKGPQTNPFIQGIGLVKRGDFGVAGMIEALQKDGLFKVIAEPNLTTVSGETANFLAGGEFPIVTTTANTTTTQFKQFGVSLAFTPYVLSNNRIRLTVAPELSEIDISRVATTNGTPSVTTRRAKTTVELAPGEAFMVAGLIRDRINSQISSVPGLAEIPIISALMRSTAYEREESELVIAVTPYIVDPVVNSDVRMPTDEFRTPSVMEMFFYGALGSMSGNADKIGQTPVLEGPIGFMTD